VNGQLHVPVTSPWGERAPGNSVWLVMGPPELVWMFRRREKYPVRAQHRTDITSMSSSLPVHCTDCCIPSPNRVLRDTDCSVQHSVAGFCASHFPTILNISRRSQWPRGLRRRYTAARLLRSWVRLRLAGTG
jgi:hypothetical protein